MYTPYYSNLILSIIIYDLKWQCFLWINDKQQTFLWIHFYSNISLWDARSSPTLNWSMRVQIKFFGAIIWCKEPRYKDVMNSIYCKPQAESDEKLSVQREPMLQDNVFNNPCVQELNYFHYCSQTSYLSLARLGWSLSAASVTNGEGADSVMENIVLFYDFS